MSTDIRWFREMLSALLELAFPNMHVAEGKPKQFLEDLLRGISGRWRIRSIQMKHNDRLEKVRPWLDTRSRGVASQSWR
jgi:hypothetical protein